MSRSAGPMSSATGGRVAARTTAPLTSAPAARSARAASASVAPVVRTSSTMRHGCPRRREESAADPHGPAHPLRAVPAAQRLLSPRRSARPGQTVAGTGCQHRQPRSPGTSGAGSQAGLPEGVDGGGARWQARCRRPVQPCPAEQHMDRAEPPSPVGAAARGDRYEQQSRRLPDSGPDSPGQAFGQHPGELPLAVFFEGEHRLRQLRAVGAGSHDRQEHRAVHRHQGRGLRFCTERCAHQQPELPFAPAAERAVFGPAADAVHRRGECQDVGRGRRGRVRQACQGLPVAATVPCCSRGRRRQVRVCGPPRHAVAQLFGTHHLPRFSRRGPRREALGTPCGERPSVPPGHDGSLSPDRTDRSVP